VKKIREVLKALSWLIIFSVSQFLILILFMLFYIIRNPSFDLNDSASIENIMNYLNDNTLFILIIQSLVFIPLFYFIYKNYSLNRIDCSKYHIVKIVLSSILLSIILNLLIITLKHFIGVNMSDNEVTLSIILGTGILGPIIEELLFRGIIYGKFRNIFTEKVAFNLSVLIFAISHMGGFFQIFFAFIIGYFLTSIYQKYGDIRLSILVHILVNITSIVVSPFILFLF